MRKFGGNLVFVALFLVAMLLGGGMIGLMPNIVETVIFTLFATVGLFALFRWRRKSKEAQQGKRWTKT